MRDAPRIVTDPVDVFGAVQHAPAPGPPDRGAPARTATTARVDTTAMAPAAAARARAEARSRCTSASQPPGRRVPRSLGRHLPLRSGTGCRSGPRARCTLPANLPRRATMPDEAAHWRVYVGRRFLPARGGVSRAANLRRRPRALTPRGSSFSRPAPSPRSRGLAPVRASWRWECLTAPRSWRCLVDQIRPHQELLFQQGSWPGASGDHSPSSLRTTARSPINGTMSSS